MLTVLQLRNPALKDHTNNISIIPHVLYRNNHFDSCNLEIRKQEIPENWNRYALCLPLIHELLSDFGKQDLKVTPQVFGLLIASMVIIYMQIWK